MASGQLSGVYDWRWLCGWVKSSISLHESPYDHVAYVCLVPGALTAIALASKNPSVHFSVVDKDASVIEAWNSDHIPIFEPGLEDIIFDDAEPLPGVKGSELHPIQSKTQSASPNYCHRRRTRRLANISFSADICKHVTDSDIIFICVDTPSEVSVSPTSRIYTTKRY